MSSGGSKNVQPKAHRPPASRSSSMRAECGCGALENISHPKPKIEAKSDLSYNMDRWLSQKPSEEPWNGLRK